MSYHPIKIKRKQEMKDNLFPQKELIMEELFDSSPNSNKNVIQKETYISLP